MEVSKLGKIISSIAICQAAAIPGLLFTKPAQNTWYRQLEKSPFNPPNWVFPVVWPTLYTLMGLSLFLVWNKGSERSEVKSALVPFSTQWALNSIWPIIFFKLKAPFYALGNIILLWGAILLTMRRFYQLSRPAGWLLLPYFLWVSFAMLLNYEVWRRNALFDEVGYKTLATERVAERELLK